MYNLLKLTKGQLRILHLFNVLQCCCMFFYNLQFISQSVIYVKRCYFPTYPADKDIRYPKDIRNVNLNEKINSNGFYKLLAAIIIAIVVIFSRIVSKILRCWKTDSQTENGMRQETRYSKFVVSFHMLIKFFHMVAKHRV